MPQAKDGEVFAVGTVKTVPYTAPLVITLVGREPMAVGAPTKPSP